jgi:hypothetical protein
MGGLAVQAYRSSQYSLLLSFVFAYFPNFCFQKPEAVDKLKLWVSNRNPSLAVSCFITPPSSPQPHPIIQINLSPT